MPIPEERKIEAERRLLEEANVQPGSVNEYIKKKLEAARAAALKKSRTRTMPAVPKIPVETGSAVDAAYAKEVADGYAGQADAALFPWAKLDVRTRMPHSGFDYRPVMHGNETPERRYERLSRLSSIWSEEAESAKGAPTVTYVDGPSCIYTATDNYGNAYRVSGNGTFLSDPGRFGFVQIPYSDAEPGDIVQSVVYDDVTGRGFPAHGMVLDGIDDRGIRRYNYSNGDTDGSAIIVHGKFHPENDTNRYRNAFRFVGTPADSLRWKQEWESMQKKNGGKIGKYQEGRTINYAGINKDAVENLKYIDDELIKAGYGYIPRLAILGNIQQESLGNPLAISSNGAWHGIIQWNKDRYRLQNRNAQDELKRQTALLLKELEKTGWSGATWRDQLKYAQAFKDSTDLRQAVDLLTRRFVRPANTEIEINKRYAHAQRGWMDEKPVQEATQVKTLPANLTPISNFTLLNNQVVDTSTRKGPVIKEQPTEIVRKPLNEMTEDDVRSLVYNSFKYAEGGNLVYKPFLSEKKKNNTSTKKSLEYTSDIEEISKPETFPIEKVKILEPDWSITYAERSPYAEGIVEYVKDDIDIGNMQELIDLMKEEGISFRITSGRRPGAITKSGHISYHSPGNALDIIPASGQSWNDLINQMRSSKRFITYMHEHNLGILDERSKEMQARTGATGAHFHIGPDKNAIINFETLIK